LESDGQSREAAKPKGSGAGGGLPQGSEFRPSPIDSALILGVVAGALYFVGSQYLDSYYGGLGLGQMVLGFQVPYVMKNSFLPLLWPAFLLVMVAIACLSVRPVTKAPSLLSPFRPIPGSQVFAVVFVTWATKLLLDIIRPNGPPDWWAWRSRDVFLFVAGSAVLAWLYWRNWKREEKRGRFWLSAEAGRLVSLFGTVLVELVVALVVNHRWPLSAFLTALLIISLVFVLTAVVRDFRARKKSNAAEGAEPVASFRPKGSDLGSALLLSLLAVLSLLLAAGLTGTSDAHKMQLGCRSFKTVAFVPVPAGLAANHTYWLILEIDGVFYARGLSPRPSNETLVFVPAAGTTAIIGDASALTKC